jgi:hypothetical protein
VTGSRFDMAYAYHNSQSVSRLITAGRNVL